MRSFLFCVPWRAPASRTEVDIRFVDSSALREGTTHVHGCISIILPSSHCLTRYLSCCSRRNRRPLVSDMGDSSASIVRFVADSRISRSSLVVPSSSLPLHDADDRERGGSGGREGGKEGQGVGYRGGQLCDIVNAHSGRWTFDAEWNEIYCLGRSQLPRIVLVPAPCCRLYANGRAETMTVYLRAQSATEVKLQILNSHIETRKTVNVQCCRCFSFFWLLSGEGKTMCWCRDADRLSDIDINRVTAAAAAAISVSKREQRANIWQWWEMNSIGITAAIETMLVLDVDKLIAKLLWRSEPACAASQIKTYLWNEAECCFMSIRDELDYVCFFVDCPFITSSHFPGKICRRKRIVWRQWLVTLSWPIATCGWSR